METKNTIWHPRKVTLEDIEERNGHKGCVVWLTGLSASGKSTIGVEVEKMLFEKGSQVVLLDGDNVRKGLNGDLGFAPEDREENIRRISELAKIFRNEGFIALTAFISPYRKDRDFARGLLKKGDFIEVFVRASVEECKRRDPKGFYKKAIAGIIPQFTGVTAPYEEPENPELVVDTETMTIEDSAAEVVNKIIEYVY